VIEADKVGGIGLGWLALWKYHGGGETRRDFFSAAVHAARVLAHNIDFAANGTVSPWPLRVYAQTGEVRPGSYTSHVIWNIQLLDAVLAIPGALSNADGAAAHKARSVAWQWMIDFPIANNNWCGYCEDVGFSAYAWEDGVCDYDSITFRMTSRYLMGVGVAGAIMPPNGGAGTDTPIPWQTAVPKMLRWVESALIFWDAPGPRDPAIQYGARCVSEQRADHDRMSCHTTSYASVLVQFAAALTKNNMNATAAADAIQQAQRSWAWSSYCLDDTGNVHVTPGEGESDAVSTQAILVGSVKRRNVL